MTFSRRPYRVTYNARQFLKLPLAYFSGFWLLITLLVLSSSPAYAEWVAIGSTEVSGGSTVYVDLETIRRTVFDRLSCRHIHGLA
jgi:hypothetical protein